MGKKRSRFQLRSSSTGHGRAAGTRIKKGLDDLHDLDVAPQQQQGQRTSQEQVFECGGNDSKKSLGSSAAGGREKDSLMQNTEKRGAKTAERKKVKAETIAHPKVIVTTTTEECCGGPPPGVFGCNWEEWKSVKKGLFSVAETGGSAEARRRALDHVELVWKARARASQPLPSYVESTALLLEAVSLDEGDKLSSLAITSFYGAVISRTVHLMTGEFAQGTDDTYRKRARAIGFPEEAVEVRQRVAHGALPLLTELRWVCGLVLQFLFQHYWLEQARHLNIMEREGRKEMTASQEKQNVRDEHKAVPRRTTVEEIRQLLEALSDDGEEEEEEVECIVTEGAGEGNHENVTHKAGVVRVGEWTLS